MPDYSGKLAMYLEQHKVIQVIGFDDTPFERNSPDKVAVCGIVCANTRFEGMLWNAVDKDGENATAVLSQMLNQSKFADQVHLVLLDGIALAGFNVVDLPALAEALQKPCLTLMRKAPDLVGIQQALAKLPWGQARLATIEKAGPIYQSGPFWFQCQGISPDLVKRILPRLTDRGHVPEALRLAHLIGAAVLKGESSKRA